MTRFTLAAVLPLAACGGTATWAPETWGEDFIEAGLPAETFADGCSAEYRNHLHSRKVLAVRAESLGHLDA